MTEPGQGGDGLLEALGALPVHDVDPWRAQRCLREAKRELGAAGARAASPAWRAAGRLYRQVLEPVGAVTLGGVYLAWAVQVALVLLGRAP
jgi:hypothetical protein